jgi:hypothetical protein
LCGVVFVGEAALRAGLDLQGISLRAVQAALAVASASHADIDRWSPADLYPLDNKREHEEMSAAILRRDARMNPLQEATRLDRLARSTKDLLNLLAAVAHKDAWFKSPRDTWADTTTPHGRLMLTVLGGLARVRARVDP